MTPEEYALLLSETAAIEETCIKITKHIVYLTASLEIERAALRGVVLTSQTKRRIEVRVNHLKKDISLAEIERIRLTKIRKYNTLRLEKAKHALSAKPRDLKLNYKQVAGSLLYFVQSNRSKFTDEEWQPVEKWIAIYKSLSEDNSTTKA